MIAGFGQGRILPKGSRLLAGRVTGSRRAGSGAWSPRRRPARGGSVSAADACEAAVAGVGVTGERRVTS